jgi:23S rRNA (guanosine2251-2'-O)-methyltransferase
MDNEKNTRGEDIIAGRNAVNEALRSGRTIDSLYVVRGAHTGSISAPTSVVR